MTQRVSVVLFNLGGPDSLKAVRPFLFNLFNDKAIISLPQPLRWCLAQLISRIRARTAVEIYAQMGGASPLVAETEAQRAALQSVLESRLDGGVQTVVAMRYWKPLTRDAARAVKAFAPDHIVLLPLYPQFSTTTTGSSVKAWRAQYDGPGQVHTVCCYPEDPDFVAAHVAKIEEVLAGRSLSELRLIFSAHGLPEKVINEGDPYQSQVERTAKRVAEAAGALDWVVCYQSRVGPLKWIGPSTVETLQKAGSEGIGVVVVPIAFVSEHSETLVELDLEYSEVAEKAGVPIYLRAPAIGEQARYIEALARITQDALLESEVHSQAAPCHERFAQCPFRKVKRVR